MRNVEREIMYTYYYSVCITIIQLYLYAYGLTDRIASYFIRYVYTPWHIQTISRGPIPPLCYPLSLGLTDKLLVWVPTGRGLSTRAASVYKTCCTVLLRAKAIYAKVKHNYDCMILSLHPFK